MTTQYKVPLIIRGKVIDTCDLEFGGRRGGVSFCAPDVSAHLGELTLRTPSLMADLYTITLEQILDYLVELGQRLDFARNVHLQEAFDLSRFTSGLSESILRFQYEHIPYFFNRTEMMNIVERSCGAAYLEGWVQQPGGLVPGVIARTRAFGTAGCHRAGPAHGQMGH